MRATLCTQPTNVCWWAVLTNGNGGQLYADNFNTGVEIQTAFRLK